MPDISGSKLGAQNYHMPLKMSHCSSYWYKNWLYYICNCVIIWYNWRCRITLVLQCHDHRMIIIYQTIEITTSNNGKQLCLFQRLKIMFDWQSSNQVTIVKSYIFHNITCWSACHAFGLAHARVGRLWIWFRFRFFPHPQNQVSVLGSVLALKLAKCQEILQEPHFIGYWRSKRKRMQST